MAEPTNARTAENVGNVLQLEIVTPKGRALSVTCDEVRAPSVEGEFGVLPGHLPMLAALQIGLVAYRSGNDEHKVAIGAGFAEVGPGRVGILTDEYIERDKVDPVAARRELAEVQKQIERLAAQAEPEAGGLEARKVLYSKENWLAAQLELYGDPPPATMRSHEAFGPPAPHDDAGSDLSGEGGDAAAPH